MSDLLPQGWLDTHGWDYWGQWRDGTWEPETLQAIRDFVTPGSTYVDVGAWVGGTVIWGAGCAKRVIAFEPDPQAFEICQQNTAEYDNVEVHPIAIAAASGTRRLVPHLGGFGASMTRLEIPDLGGRVGNCWDLDSGIDVETLSLADAFDRYHIRSASLVKMDIEGGELEILPEACGFLAAQGTALLVSMHVDWWPHPLDVACFEAFSEVRGDLAGQRPVLCLP